MALRSLDDVHQRDRLATMRAWFGDGDVPVDFRVAHDHGLGGHLGAASIGSLGVTEMLVTGADGSLHRRTRTGASDPDLLLVNVTDSGTSAVRQNGSQAALPPGRPVLTSTRYDLEARQWRSSHRFSIVVPYAVLGLSARMIDPLLATRLRLEEAFYTTVSGFLLRVARQAAAGDGALARLETPIVDMVRGVLAAAAGDDRAARAPLAETLFPRVMEYVSQRVFDPRLSAASIAHAHGISVRYLYTVLAREGVSLGDRIREKRAGEAARLLADPSCTLSIAEIAYRTGYADQAHFSRSFRRWYSTTPREWRRLHQAGAVLH
ncbi:AraC family transcriptional regulator [Galbitalea sp. SE-J8]|uniref:AraC family transcriptional regulator n=1 Tax=Galbitalea sp. SE-J8 TaxID=3054952 RepID=UPI00259CE2CF|nr:AraC family transcriptional regulator [Galbitalea sp. SE-J8]MDM4761982.1 AraC family transcriptional regulator [Galbitalea sp. SE-J8]